MELEIALEDEYFVERKLYPNVDFYSGIIFKAIISQSMFTVLCRPVQSADLAVNEMIEIPARKSAGRATYIGETERDFVPLGDR